MGGPGGSWSDADHARVLAQRKAATERLASFEAALDEADAYTDAILQRLEADLKEGDPITDPSDDD